MPYAALDGVDLYYEEHGAEGPPLVLAHGFFGNHAAWYQQIPFLEQHYRVVTYDQRGFGLSHDKSGAGPGQAVDDLRNLLDHLDIASCALAAHSMGGNCCLGFAVQYPERVRALVMADTLGNVVLPEPLKQTQEERAQSIRGLSIVQRVLSEAFAQANPEAVQLFLQVYSFNQGHTPASQPRPRVPITLEEAAGTLAALPVQFLVGEKDLLQPVDIVTSVAESIPGCELTVVPGAGHSVYFERPDVFNDTVHGFLSARLS